MTYGSTIGEKFYEDGSVRRYPGNTIVADILPGCGAYDVMTRYFFSRVCSIFLVLQIYYHLRVLRCLLSVRVVQVLFVVSAF